MTPPRGRTGEARTRPFESLFLERDKFSKLLRGRSKRNGCRKMKTPFLT